MAEPTAITLPGPTAITLPGPMRDHLARAVTREGLLTLPRRPESEQDPRKSPRKLTRDKPTAIARAHALRATGLSLRQVAAQLVKERILPARSDLWHAASILDLLRQPAPAPATT